MSRSKLKKSNVYVLVFPKLDAFKIGKADNVNSRLRALEKTWGLCGRSKSYYLPTSSSHVFTLEKSLHMALKDSRMQMSKADGYTEFFKLDSIDSCKNIINVFSEPMNLTPKRILPDVMSYTLMEMIEFLLSSERQRYTCNQVSDELNVKNDDQLRDSLISSIDSGVAQGIRGLSEFEFFHKQHEDHFRKVINEEIIAA